ncbi:MAG: hypothetical protein K8R53_15635 [Bacteroidales bacterium]|nr:hypothetical protein [Bacteroidales bacterium]
MIQIKNSSDVVKANFTYDVLGRRIEVEDIVAGTTTRYYYDGWRVLSETDENGTQLRKYVYGKYLDEILIKIEDNEDIYYAHDHLFSVVALIDDDGDAIERYEYDAYGKQTIFEPNFSAERNTSSYNNVIAFTGQRLDDLDGNNHLLIMYYKNRYYLVDIGRFIQRDPLGVNDGLAIVYFADNGSPQSKSFNPFGQYTDGMNLYEAFKSNPTRYTDPLGTDIYLITGNNSWNPINNLIHQKVCVDKWNTMRATNGEIRWIKEGKICFSFALVRWQGKYGIKKSWLGWKYFNISIGCSIGEIYLDGYTGGRITKQKSTTAEQDVNWLNYMLSKRVGFRDLYTVNKFNCRLYSQLEYRDSPNRVK